MKSSKWIIVYVALATLFAIVISVQTRRAIARQALPASEEVDTDRTGQLQKITLQHDEVEREYYLRLPDNFRVDEKLPVLFVLHGGGRAGGRDMAERWNAAKLADKERFILVYPNGVNNQWNDGRDDFAAGTRDADDVGYLSAVIDQVNEQCQADASRVYFTGASNGGMMSFRIGCELADKVAAIAPVIANMPRDIYDAARENKPSHKMPVLVINGTDDPLVPYDGGHVSVFGRNRGEVVSTDASIEFWKRHNGLNSETSLSQIPDADPDDGCTVHVTRFGGDNIQAPVVLYSIRGGGHTIPGMDLPRRTQRLVGKVNQDFEAVDAIWEFCKDFRREQK
ncbi:MAG: alpha/beta hydrolase family esterase [Pirellulaceae bacterium]